MMCYFWGLHRWLFFPLTPRAHTPHNMCIRNGHTLSGQQEDGQRADGTTGRHWNVCGDSVRIICSGLRHVLLICFCLFSCFCNHFLGVRVFRSIQLHPSPTTHFYTDGAIFLSQKVCLRPVNASPACVYRNYWVSHFPPVALLMFVLWPEGDDPPLIPLTFWISPGWTRRICYCLCRRLRLKDPCIIIIV